MPSRRDYYRLKAVLQTLRVKNVTLEAKGNYKCRRSWARQSSGASLCRIPKFGNSSCGAT